MTPTPAAPSRPAHERRDAARAAQRRYYAHAMECPFCYRGQRCVIGERLDNAAHVAYGRLERSR